MIQQSKRDLIAAIAIALMFAGALLLPISAFGVALIGAGMFVVLLLILSVARERP